MPTIPTPIARGALLAAATALISGVSVFLNGLLVKGFEDPVVLVAARNGLVGLVLVAVVLGRGQMAEVRRLPRRSLAALAAVAVIGGSVPFILFFSGLAAASGPGAALIHKTMFVWVALLAVPLLRESLGAPQLAALAALVGGTLLLGPADGLGAGGAEVLILAATILWAIEVVVVRHLLARVGIPVAVAAAARMALGAVAVLGFLLVTGRAGGLMALTLAQWSVIAVTGALLLGYVVTWYAALQAAPATIVSSVLVGGAVVTALLTVVRTGDVPGPVPSAGLALVALGVIVVLLGARRLRPQPATTG